MVRKGRDAPPTRLSSRAGDPPSMNLCDAICAILQTTFTTHRSALHSLSNGKYSRAGQASAGSMILRWRVGTHHEPTLTKIMGHTNAEF